MIRALLAVLLLSAFTADQKMTLKDAGVVRLQYVQTGGEYKIRSDEIARAVRSAEGRRYILINLDADQSNFEQWFLHEMAHHIAWNRHGEDIEAHGPEFRKICRQLVTRRQSYFCKGDE